MEDYKKDKRKTVQTVTDRLRKDLEALMKTASLSTNPIVIAEDIGEI